MLSGARQDIFRLGRPGEGSNSGWMCIYKYAKCCGFDTDKWVLCDIYRQVARPSQPNKAAAKTKIG